VVSALNVYASHQKCCMEKHSQQLVVCKNDTNRARTSRVTEI
jgi:hypothetical protein